MKPTGWFLNFFLNNVNSLVRQQRSQTAVWLSDARLNSLLRPLRPTLMQRCRLVDVREKASRSGWSMLMPGGCRKSKKEPDGSGCRDIDHKPSDIWNMTASAPRHTPSPHSFFQTHLILALLLHIQHRPDVILHGGGPSHNDSFTTHAGCYALIIVKRVSVVLVFTCPYKR